MTRVVFIDNIFSETDSDIRDLPSNIVFSHEPSSLRLEIPRNYALATPIDCLYIQKNLTTMQHSIEIILQENSELMITDEHQGNTNPYTASLQLNIIAKKNARLHY